MITLPKNPTDRDTAASAAVGVLGAVLCGGESRRMGADKARLELRGRSLLAGAAQVVGAVADRVVLASGAGPRYPELGLDEVPDRVPGGGPLAGLEAVLEVASSEGFAWVLAVACDMPGLEEGVLSRLVDEARRTGADACLLQSPEGVEPLYAVYHRRCHAAVRRALERGERRMIAFHPEVRVATLAVAGASARNLNTPDELRAEREAPR